MKKIIFLLFFSFLLLIPFVCSSVVEIVIEYENITTTTSIRPSTTTTTTRPSGGVVIRETTTTTAVSALPNISIGYEMPASLEIYMNETRSLTVTIKNFGSSNLTNITLQITGIPSNSFKVSPSIIGLIEPGFASHFTVSIDASYLQPKNYTLTFTVISEETSESATMLLIVKEYTKEVGEKLEEVEKYEEARKAWITFKFLFISILIVAVVLLGLILYFHRSLRCPVCGAKLKKDYEDENFVYYKCLVCGYRKVKLKG